MEEELDVSLRRVKAAPNREARVDPQLLFKHHNDFTTNLSDSLRCWPTEILKMRTSSNEKWKHRVCFRFDARQQFVLDPADLSETINK